MSAWDMKRIDTKSVNPEELRLLLSRPPLEEVKPSPSVAAHTEKVFGRPLSPAEAVAQIVSDVEAYGDSAVIDYMERIDGVSLTPESFFVEEEELEAALYQVDPKALAAIRLACDRIRRFHEKQKERSWFEEGPGGEILGQRVLPLEKVACYVPAGRAPLMSTAMMSVVPAKVAGVAEVIAATPCDEQGKVHPYVLAALKEAGADRILRIGGAQAIGALAFGTTWIPKVDKIVGPGNLFVTLAKKAVFGRVGIDALNGPSEVVIIADRKANPRWVAVDLLSQAEHDPEAAAILFTDDDDFSKQVLSEIQRLLPDMKRAAVIRESLAAWGAIVLCRDLQEAAFWVNVIAPEHVQLMVEEPWSLLPHIRFAGAVFLGGYAPVPLGDYIAGPNHILPTNGTARFASPLGVYDFVRRTSLVAFGEEGFSSLAQAAETLAGLEGLFGHGDSLRMRRQSEEE